MQWESEGIKLPDVGKKIVSSALLNGGEVSVKQTDDGIEVFVPEQSRDKYGTIVVLEVEC